MPQEGHIYALSCARSIRHGLLGVASAVDALEGKRAAVTWTPALVVNLRQLNDDLVQHLLFPGAGRPFLASTRLIGYRPSSEGR